MDKKILLKRYIIPAICGFFILGLIPIAVDSLDMASYYDDVIEEEQEKKAEFLENYTPYSPEGYFLGADSIIDNSELIKSKDRSEILQDIKAVYNYTGVQFVYYITSPEEGNQYNTKAATELTNELFDELSASSEDNGVNICLVTFVLRDGNSEYIMKKGSEADKIIDELEIFSFDYEWYFDYAIRSYDSDDNEYYTREEGFISDLTTAFWDVSDCLDDPDSYFAENIEWDLENQADYRKSAIIEIIVAIIFALVGALNVKSTIKIKKKNSHQDDWNAELAEFSNFSVTSGFDDIDNADNPYHDLVAKYGGFDKENVQKNVQEEN